MWYCQVRSDLGPNNFKTDVAYGRSDNPRYGPAVTGSSDRSPGGLGKGDRSATPSDRSLR